MSAPPDVDLGQAHQLRQAELDKQKLLDWAQERMAAIQPAQPTFQDPNAQLQDPSTPPTPETAPNSQDAVIRAGKDIGRGAVEALPQAVLGGVPDAFKSLAALPKDMADFVSSRFPDFVRDLPQGVIYEPGKGLRLASGRDLEQVPGTLEKVGELIPSYSAPKSVTGGLARGVGQFLTGFLLSGATKPIQALGELGRAGALAQPLAQGALASFAALDPQQERLSNLVQQFPQLQNPVTEYLQSKPGDSDAEGRFKSAVEGLGLGVLTDGFVRGVRALRDVSMAKAAAGVTDEAAQGALRVAQAEQAEVAARVGDPAGPRLQIIQPESLQPPAAASARALPLPATGKDALADAGRLSWEDWADIWEGKFKPGIATEDGHFITGHDHGDALNRAMDEGHPVAGPEELGQRSGWKIGNTTVFTKDLQDEGPRGVYDALRSRARAIPPPPQIPPEVANSPRRPVPSNTAASQPGEVFVNWATINAPEDVKQTIQDLADARAGNIDVARRGVRTWEATRLDAATKDAWETLRSRQVGETLNAENTVAARELWVRSGARVRELARAVTANGGELDLLAFRRQLHIHNAIQEQVIAARTETARALNAWRIPVTGDVPSFAAQFDQIRNMLGSDTRNLQQIAKGIVSTSEAGLQREAEEFIATSALSRTPAAIRQAWYGALLSSPKTFVRNLVGNTSQMLLQVPETKVANYIGKLFGEQNVPDGEAMERLFGMVQGYKDAWTTSAKSRQVFETALQQVQDDPEAARALFAEEAEHFFAPGGPGEAQGMVHGYEMRQQDAFGQLGEAMGFGPETMAGRFFSFLDTATTAPSNALQRSDEIFKAMSHNAAKRGLAFRQASSEVASGAVTPEAFPERLAEILANPTDMLRLGAQGEAAVGTFTNAPLNTPLWQLIQKWHNVPVLGDVTMPFARTPYNIATQTLQRTPLAPFMKSWQADIAAGGARADLALARTATGSAILLTAADLAMNGALTGRGSSDPAEMATRRRTGWQPWSVKVGDRYFDYRAMDPVGPLMGLAAGTAEILMRHDFADAASKDKLEKMVAATTMAIASQVTQQSFMTGAAQFFNAIQDPERYGESYWQNLVSAFVVPRGLAALERVTEPNQRYAWDIVDQIYAQTPGLSSTLPLARDRWGREVSSESGFGPWYDLVVPFQSRQEKPEPIDAELERLQHYIGNPAKKFAVEGVTIDLSGKPKEYSRYQELAGNAWKDEQSGLGLKDFLNALVTGKGDSSEMYEQQDDGPDGTKAKMIDDFVDYYQTMAKQQLTEEFPWIRAQVDAEQQKRLGQGR